MGENVLHMTEPTPDPAAAPDVVLTAKDAFCARQPAAAVFHQAAERYRLAAERLEALAAAADAYPVGSPVEDALWLVAIGLPRGPFE